MARKIPTCSDPGVSLPNARAGIDKEKKEEKNNLRSVEERKGYFSAMHAVEDLLGTRENGDFATP